VRDLEGVTSPDPLSRASLALSLEGEGGTPERSDGEPGEGAPLLAGVGFPC
jgi:hypothetical protein